MRPLAAVSLLVLLALGGCATQPMARPGEEKGVGRAVQQPIRDLSLIREQAPASLQKAVAAPYDRATPGGCPEVVHEIAQLDEALGPDIDSGDRDKGGLSATGLAADLVGGAVGLPFRGIVRHMTGAEQRDRDLRAAVLAGMVRRGFLKGRLAEMSCEAPSHAAGAQP